MSAGLGHACAEKSCQVRFKRLASIHCLSILFQRGLPILKVTRTVLSVEDSNSADPAILNCIAQQVRQIRCFSNCLTDARLGAIGKRRVFALAADATLSASCALSTVFARSKISQPSLI